MYCAHVTDSTDFISGMQEYLRRPRILTGDGVTYVYAYSASLAYHHAMASSASCAYKGVLGKLRNNIIISLMQVGLQDLLFFSVPNIVVQGTSVRQAGTYLCSVHPAIWLRPNWTLYQIGYCTEMHCMQIC